MALINGVITRHNHQLYTRPGVLPITAGDHIELTEPNEDYLVVKVRWRLDTDRRCVDVIVDVEPLFDASS